jgi:GMP synthase (glutamine-hydrolysing)
VREEGVYSEIVPFQAAEAAFAAMKPKAVIPAEVDDEDLVVLGRHGTMS